MITYGVGALIRHKSENIVAMPIFNTLLDAVVYRDWLKMPECSIFEFDGRIVTEEEIIKIKQEKYPSIINEKEKKDVIPE